MPRSITVTGLPFTNFSKIGWSMIPGLLANSRRDRDTHSLWRAAATFKGLTQAPQGCQMCAKRLSSAQMSKNSHALSCSLFFSREPPGGCPQEGGNPSDDD